jgi:alpha-glucosidase
LWFGFCGFEPFSGLHISCNALIVFAVKRAWFVKTFNKNNCKSRPLIKRWPVRTPMPWDTSENAGFTTAKPWLPLNGDWPTRNVARMMEESQSILTLYRRLLAIRRLSLALSIGEFVLLNGEDDILAYERRHDAERLIVALNLGGRPHRLLLPDWARGSRLLLSTVDDAALVEGDALLLRSNEGVILKAG